MLNRSDNLLRNHPVVVKWLLVLTTVLAFGGTLGNSFVYDDGRQVLENPFVRNPHLWRRIFTGPVWSFLGAATETNFYRPLHILSHFLVWQVAGANPAAFHLYQLVFYAITVLLVYRLGRDLLQNHVTAFAGALLWALHPLHVEPVCWIAGVPDCGCGLFYVLAFLIFLRGERAPERRWAWHLLGALVYFLALFFKEMAISMPLLLAAYWLVIASPEAWWRKGLRWLPYAAAAAGYIGIRLIVLGHVSHAPHLWKISPRVAMAAVGLLGQHTKLFFWPTDLNDFRDFDLGASLRSPWPWVTLLVIGLAILLRKRDPALCFLILWWPVTLIPSLDVRQLSYPLLAERFSYLPSMGLCLAVASFALHTLPARFPDRHPARVLVPALGLSLVLFSVQDLRAVPRWRDNDTLWNYSYQVAPKTALVHVHRALDLQYRYYDPAGATQEYKTAIMLNHTAFIELPSVTYDCFIGLGEIAAVQGHMDEAITYFQKAIDLTPRYSAAYDVLGSVYFPRGDYARAAEYFQQAVRANPLDMGARFFLGTCWMKLGKPAQAAEQFHAAREVDPGYAQAFVAEAAALEAAGDKAGAARVRGEMTSQ
ncbi:MAG: tetratricopeptide repeat protein [Terriglobia bacterium]